MRGLSGDLKTMPLPELMDFLSRHQASGKLTLEDRRIRKQVLLEQAYVVNAASNLPREFLGQFLINLGHITEEQFDLAFKKQQEERRFLGQILVARGLVPIKVMQSVLALKARETLLEACTWAGGTFTFDPDATLPKEDGLQVRVALADIENEVAFRKKAWEQILVAFPRGDLTLELDRSHLVSPPRPGSLDEKMFALIESGQTLEEVALHLHATRFFLFNRLYAYYQVGALSVQRTPASDGATAPSLSRPSQFIRQAQAARAEGRFGDAFAAAWLAQEAAPSTGTAKLLEELEAEWGPRLVDHFLKAPLVLMRTTAKAPLRDVGRCAAGRYLLSRVDGKRSVAQIVRIAPLRDFETLAFLSQFIAQGLLTQMD